MNTTTTHHKVSGVDPALRVGTCSVCGPTWIAQKKKGGKPSSWACGRKKTLKGRGYFLQKKYQITPKQYEMLLHAQGGVCAICGSASEKRFLGVDHCHKTGQIRGLLCDNCNQGIGKFFESPDLLRKAIDYLGFRGGEHTVL